MTDPLPLSGDDLVYWSTQAQEQERSTVKDQRAIAEKWATGLAGLTSLIALAAVVKGPEAFSELSPVGQIFVICTAGLGFALLLLGSLAAMRAAYGSGSEQPVTGGLGLWVWTHRETGQIGIHLRRAKVLFFLGIVLIALANGGTWLATPDSPKPVNFIIEKTNGELTCGQVDGTKFAPDAHFLSTQPKEGDPMTERIEVSEIKSVRMSEVCPSG